MSLDLRGRAADVGQVGDWLGRSVVSELPDQVDPRHAIHPGVGDDQIALAKGVSQLDSGLSVMGMKDRVTVTPEGANHKGDDGGVLVGDEDVPPVKGAGAGELIVNLGSRETSGCPCAPSAIWI